MSWQVKSIKCQEGPSPEWPQMGYGWSFHLNASNQKDLLQVLELLDQSFKNEEIYDFTLLADFFGCEQDCLEAYRDRPDFFWTKLCAYLVIRLLPSSSPKFVWSDILDQGFISGQPSWLLDEAISIAINLLENAISGNSYQQGCVSSRHRIQQKSRWICQHAFTNSMQQYCELNSIPYFILPVLSGPFPTIQIGICSQSQLVRSSSTANDSMIGHFIASNKIRSHAYLQHLGIPVPSQLVISKDQQDCSDLIQAIREMWPVVVKPDQAEQGAGISMNIDSLVSLQDALKKAKPFATTSVIIQEQISGDYYRFAILNGGLSRVLKAVPPYIKGDGVSTVQQLINQVNGDRRSTTSPSAEWVEQPYSLDQLNHSLDGDLIQLHTIPSSDERIILPHRLDDRRTWVLSEAIDQVNSLMAQMMIRLARNLGLSNVGIDVVSSNLAADPYCDQDSFCILELNTIQSIGLNLASSYIESLPGHENKFTVPISTVVLSDASVDVPSMYLQHSTCAIHSDLYKINSLCLDRFEELNCDVIVYKKVGEILASKSINSVCFILVWDDFVRNGLPCPVNEKLFFVGKWAKEQEDLINQFSASSEIAVSIN
ncbi:hypothetical protein N9U07_00310 [bacterium]|nr:hypothetical protein [bacterium]